MQPDLTHLSGEEPFFLHSLDDKQESIFLESLSDATIKGDLIYFEFRTNEDLATQKIYEGHFRRYVNSDELLKDWPHLISMLVIILLAQEWLNITKKTLLLREL